VSVVKSENADLLKPSYNQCRLNDMGDRETFREQWVGGQAKADYGRIKEYARLTGVSYRTACRWCEPGGSLPDIYEAKMIAESFAESPAWFAYGIGPRRASVAAAAFAVADAVARDPDLLAVWDALIALPAETRADLLGAARLAHSIPAPVGHRPLTGSATNPAEQPGTRRELLRVNDAPRRLNRRADLPFLHLDYHRPGRRRRVPPWLVSAGPGRELERANECEQYQEIPDADGCHTARVIGESMLDTLRPGDLVVLRAICGAGGIHLPPVESRAQRNARRILETHVRHGDVCLLSLNEDPPTLKRVCYEGGETDWHLVLRADNPAAHWGDAGVYLVHRADQVRFYARLIGLCATAEE
jgi:hypothetical protein